MDRGREGVVNVRGVRVEVLEEEKMVFFVRLSVG